jgi:hypothetical protein
MRRATLWSVMLAAALAACGGDSGSDKPAGEDQGGTDKETDDVAVGDGDNTGNTGGDGAGEALCPIAQGGGLGGYEGVKTWTRADFEACQVACPTFEEACITASCAAGFETFDTCVGSEVNACLSAPEGPCRDEFEAHLCCADEKCDLADAAAAECVSAQCAPTRDGFLACGDGGGIEACIAPAALACFAEPAAGDAEGGATTEAIDTIPSELNVQLLIGRSWRLAQ